MSRVGKKPIVIPEKVDVKIDGQTVIVKGPLGELKTVLHPSASVSLVEADGKKELQVAILNEDNAGDRAQWGTARANVANMLNGVTTGYTKSLEINGVGFRVALAGKKLTFALGFSHDVEFLLPEGITAKVEKNVVTVSGADKQMVGETAAQIRALKKPEPYKGKGIRYIDEVVRRKAGKTAKTGE
jgi:large subunit ribosomal protein L6